MSRIVLFTAFWCTAAVVFAQKKYTVETYIDEFKHIAMEEMDKTGIPASITLAQGILESGYGNSELALKSNNHFGIKCHTEWSGKKTYYDDDRRGECFRVYRDPEDSYRDHSEFLVTRSRYEFLFDYSSTEYKKWAHGLKKAGYATNPKYGHLLVKLIEDHQLYLYDRPGRDMIARNGHGDRNDHHEVNSRSDYKPHENKVQTASAVEGTNIEPIFSYNGIRTVVAGKYDDIRTIAERHYMPVKRLMKYNDLKAAQALYEGQYVYLQPKRGRTEKKYHIVKGDDSMWSISQQHGVKLFKLQSRNQLAEHEEPAVGETVFLNKKAGKKPALRENKPGYDHSKDEVVFEMADADEDVRELVLETESSEHQVVVRQQEANGAMQEEAAAAGSGSATQAVSAVSDALYAGRKVHTVKKGDTLYSISKLYAISLEELKSWNKLADNLISIDQKLIVSD
jgi:LysM repeat protein